MLEWLTEFLRALGVLFVNFPSEITQENLDEGRIILVTFVFTLFTASVAYVFARRRDITNFRNTNSVDLYRRERTDLNSAIRELHGSIFNQGDECTPISHDVIKNRKEQISTITDHFEMVAVGISDGYLSERYVRRTERHYINCCFMSLSQMVAQIREYYGNRYALKYFEFLFIRTYFNFYRICSFPIEVIIGRPMFTVSHIIFRLEYHVYRRIVMCVCPSERFFRKVPPNPLDCDWVFIKPFLFRMRLPVIATVTLGGLILTIEAY